MSYLQAGASNCMRVTLSPLPQRREVFQVPKCGRQGAEPAESHTGREAGLRNQLASLRDTEIAE